MQSNICVNIQFVHVLVCYLQRSLKSEGDPFRSILCSFIICNKYRCNRMIACFTKLNIVYRFSRWLDFATHTLNTCRLGASTTFWGREFHRRMLLGKKNADRPMFWRMEQDILPYVHVRGELARGNLLEWPPGD